MTEEEYIKWHKDMHNNLLKIADCLEKIIKTYDKEIEAINNALKDIKIHK